ncbi:MAG: anthranilate phosphoribosyltransferase [Epsilonproteobacteria bacterium]|nr:anthranilate phosphoribosyltransferase [Campylobacterota bacterium]
MTYEEALEKFKLLFENKLSQDEAKELLIQLYQKGESANEIAAAAEVMREHSIKLPIDEELRDKLIDNCGTGGDKSNTFNISTTVSILLASGGCYVAKHGNRSITSKSGSADMLEALGINLNLTPQQQATMLEEVGFCFIFAQNHHPAMKYIMPIRKSLNHRTIFNILGPLTNPAGVKRQLIGVFDTEYVEKVINALIMLGSKRAMVVSSLDGLDEISIEANTKAALYNSQRIQQLTINPHDYKLAGKKANLIGGDAKENAKITMSIFDGEKGDRRNIVVLNAAAALLVDNKVTDLQSGVEMAQELIDSKKAKEKLQQIIQISNKL